MLNQECVNFWMSVPLLSFGNKIYWIDVKQEKE